VHLLFKGDVKKKAHYLILATRFHIVYTIVNDVQRV